MIVRYLMIILVVVTLGACSPLSTLTDVLLPSNEPAIEVDTQLGQNNTKQVVGVQQEEINTAARDIVTVNNEEIPMWVFLVALLGWVLPTPTQMFLRLTNKISKKDKTWL